MEFSKIVIIVLIIYLISVFLSKTMKEPFANDIENDPLKKLRKERNIFDTKDDELFKDVITYMNENGRFGIDKCVDECNGLCVEFGVTGIAHCFPKDK
jgi:hypothetical protein